MNAFEELTCKSCKGRFAYILKHLAKDKDCRSTYNENEYKSLKLYSKDMTDSNKRIAEANRYQKNKTQRAKKYLENKVKIAKHYRRNKEIH